jgi:hypothetical protein
VIVRKKISALQLVLSAFCMLSLFGLPVFGQDKDNDAAVEHPNGLVQDWSHRHAVYPRTGPIQNLIKVQNDPRAIHSWQEAARSDWRRWNHLRSHPATGQSTLQRDWSISLGTGTTAPSMYPAKFGFDPNATISLTNCTTDFIVYPVNTVGSSGVQPNIVGFNNLYRGPTSGLCNIAATGTDDGIRATAMWSYDVHAAGGMVATSPVLSFDGTKVAFVETKSSGPAHFHVLAWKSTDGVPGNLQTVTSAKTISSFLGTQPAAGSGAATDLALIDTNNLGATSDDTLSSPFFEYGRDLAYVGDDNGVLFRIKNVFCLYAGCTGAGSPAPSLDTTWGVLGTGAISTGCGGKLTAPVVDGHTGNVFVGCSDGKIYGFTSAGVALGTPTLTVGDGTTFGGIVDPPIVDGVHGLIYAVSGSPSVLVQANTDFTGKVTATLGSGGTFNVHAPTFNDAYFSNVLSTTWVIYALGQNGTNSILYGVGFNGSRAMNSTTVTDTLGIGPHELTPLTEFVSGGEDRLFESDLTPTAGTANTNDLVSFRVDGVTTASFTVGAPQSFASEGCGTSGIVIDNASGSTQAASVYFGVAGGCVSPQPNANSAVKLTQGAFN